MKGVKVGEAAAEFRRVLIEREKERSSLDSLRLPGYGAAGWWATGGHARCFRAGIPYCHENCSLSRTHRHRTYRRITYALAHGVCGDQLRDRDQYRWRARRLSAEL